MFHACAKSLSSSIWSHNANIIVCCSWNVALYFNQHLTTLVTVEPAEAHLPLLSIIRTGNEACGRVSKQFFPQWKQGAAIFWAVWVTRSCSSVCLFVSCCFHPEACAVCQRPTQVHVPLCGVVPLWFSEPNHIFMVYSRTIFTLSLTEATQEIWSNHTKTKRSGQCRQQFPV